MNFRARSARRTACRARLAPLENAERYFDLAGTPEADKKHVVAIGGHFIPREVLIQETLDWLDRYQGPAIR